MTNATANSQIISNIDTTGFTTMENQLREKFQNIGSELKTQILERSHIIDASLAALLSNSHVLMLGQPGTAKSLLTDELCRRITGTKYFQYLLTRFSTPEEVFGPVSLKGLENDEYRRITDGKLPEAHVAFLDETFKGNAAILNSLLTAINERKFDNGKHRTDIPLISLFGASNELPQADELGALYDRFILKFDVKYLKDKVNWMGMVAGMHKANRTTTVTLDELYKAQKMVDQVSIPNQTLQAMYDIKMTLERVGIFSSDRKWRQSVPVLKAASWLRGGTEVQEQDLELLCDMLWFEPNQRAELVKTVVKATNPVEYDITVAFDEAESIFTQFDPKGKDTNAIMEAVKKLRATLEKMNNLVKGADKSKLRRSPELVSQVKGWYEEALKALSV